MGNLICLRKPNERHEQPVASLGSLEVGAAPVSKGLVVEGDARSPFDVSAAIIASYDIDKQVGEVRGKASLEVKLTTNGIVPSVPVTHDVLSLQPCQQLLDSVQLINCIGSGAFALVYRGLYQGSDCAVKFMCSNSLDKTAVREALVGPQLHHPQVVQTYITRGAVLTREFLDSLSNVQATPSGAAAIPSLPSCGSEDGFGNPKKVSHDRQGWSEMFTRIGAGPNQTMVMAIQELCEHGSLLRAIQQGMFQPKEGARTEHLARRSLLRTASEISRGMIHLHAASVIHGDLKPQNVLLAKSRADRRGYTAKVADFGLSHVLGGNSKIQSSTCGTVAYMGPEVFNGTLSKASDVYAMGVILWEMLTGLRVYDGLSMAQIMLGVSLQELAPEWPDSLWPEFCQLGRKCMAPEPSERPTFAEVERILVQLELGVRSEGKARREAERQASLQFSVGSRTPTSTQILCTSEPAAVDPDGAIQLGAARTPPAVGASPRVTLATSASAGDSCGPATSAARASADTMCARQ